MASDLVTNRPGARSIGPPSHSDATAIADDVWMSPGLSNTFAIGTGAHRIIINTGMGFEAGVHKAVFDAVCPLPTRYILFTQGHVDHVGGADVFREGRTLMVGQANNAMCQADDERIHRFRVRRSVPYWADAVRAANEFFVSQGPDAQIPAQSKPSLDIAFDDQFNFALDGQQVLCVALPGGETVDSMGVWLQEKKIFFAGNVFSALFGHFPNLVTLRADRIRFALPFLESVKRVQALEPEVLCTGHFDPIRGADQIHGELQRIIDCVQWVHDETVRGMNDGKDVRTLMRTVRPPSDLSLGEGYGKVSWGVRAIWEGYAGWFHASSTTELYPFPESDVSADLVDAAGGSDVLVARAVDYLAESNSQPEYSDHEETERKAIAAVRLLQIVLDYEPGHMGAVQAMIEAHQLLSNVHNGSNFWLSGWLDTRIAGLTAARQGLGDQ